MRKPAIIGLNDATTFTWMTITGLALAPVAMFMMGGLPLNFPAAAPALTLGDPRRPAPAEAGARRRSFSPA